MKPSLVCLVTVGLIVVQGLARGAADTKNEPTPKSIPSEKPKGAPVAAVVDVRSLRTAAKIGDAKGRIPVNHDAEVVGAPRRLRVFTPTRLPQDPIRSDAGR